MKSYLIVYAIKDEIECKYVQTGILKNRHFPSLQDAQEELMAHICSEIEMIKTKLDQSFAMDNPFQKWSETKPIPTTTPLFFFNKNGDFALSIYSNKAHLRQDDDKISRIFKIYEFDHETGEFELA